MNAMCAGDPVSRGPTAFDSEALPRLIGSRDGALLAELYGLFRASCLESLKALEAHLGTGDSAAAALHAHRLKSASAQVGALALSELCAAFEARTRSAQPALLDRFLLSEILESAALTLAWIEQRLGAAGSEANETMSGRRREHTP
jgi:HPt (histidine-containing phosphotransfer) domain-containing protein